MCVLAFGHHIALLSDVDNHATLTHLSENAGLDLGAEVFERDRLGVRDAARRSIVVISGGVELLETGGRLAGVTQRTIVAFGAASKQSYICARVTCTSCWTVSCSAGSCACAY